MELKGSCTTLWFHGNKSFTYPQMREVLKKSPVVIIDALVLQDKQLAHVPGSDVTRNLYRPAAVIFIINFDYLQEKRNRRVCQPLSSGDTLSQHSCTTFVIVWTQSLQFGPCGTSEDSSRYLNNNKRNAANTTVSSLHPKQDLLCLRGLVSLQSGRKQTTHRLCRHITNEKL